MTDTTTVRITISGRDEYQFLYRLETAPHDRTEHRDSGLVELCFREWNHPASHEFHFDGIPFSGFHSEGESFEPHRMCGDGETCAEIYCDREGHLYVVVDENTGLPNRHSADAVRAFLAFEKSARSRMSPRCSGSV